MTLLSRLQLLATTIATGTLVATYALRSYWLWTVVFIACALWFWYGRRLRWGAAPSVTTAAFVGGAVVGLWAGIRPLYMLLVVTAALSLWDLSGLEQRIGSVTAEMTAALVKAHLARLVATIVAGWFAVPVVLAVDVHLGFWPFVALALFFILTLNFMLRVVRNETQPGREF